MHQELTTSREPAAGWKRRLCAWFTKAAWKRLSWYPPFLAFGIDLRWSDDAHRLDVTVPLRWYFRNNSGAMFGGAMLVASDPFPALMLQRLIPGCVAFTGRHEIRYLRPAQSAVSFFVELGRDEVAQLADELRRRRRAQKQYEYYLRDVSGRRVAKVTTNAVLIASGRGETLPRSADVPADEADETSGDSSPA